MQYLWSKNLTILSSVKKKKKRIINLVYKRGLLFKKPKESDRFKETLKGMLQPMFFIDINTNSDRK